MVEYTAALTSVLKVEGSPSLAVASNGIFRLACKTEILCDVSIILFESNKKFSNKSLLFKVSSNCTFVKNA